METYCGIPIVDLDSPTADENVVSRNLTSALADVGFVYIKTKDIIQQEVDAMFSYSARFFDLPLSVKQSYRFPTLEDKPACGFVPPEDETFEEGKPLDIKEALDLFKTADSSVWPSDEHVPGFKAATLNFMDKLQKLAHRLMSLAGKGLRLENPELLTELYKKGDDMQFRMVDYPQIASMSEVKVGQLRCSEHTDYGGFTILFQDSCGGLQVMNKGGEYIDAVPLEGTALVNIGDFIAMCTGGQLKSTAHRVLISEENFHRRRQSLVYFADPDADKIVEAAGPLGKLGQLSGPISYKMWRNQRFKETKMKNNMCTSLPLIN